MEPVIDQAETYGIPAEYPTNPVEVTNDQVSGDNYWNRSRIRLSALYQHSVYAVAAALIDELQLGSVTDVGCGVGTKLKLLHDAKPSLSIRGIDQPDAIELCKKLHPFGDWEAADLSVACGPSPVKSDLVICADVIEHLANPDLLLDRLRQQLKPGGYILISTPARELLHFPDPMHRPIAHHVREWSSEEFNHYLGSRGFTVLRQEHHLPLKPSLHFHCLQIYLPRILRGKPLKTNQVYLLQPANPR
ncbi:MAG: class I SAM-dependent methyltransferase [Gammaproteobacteria bacterium]|nr:class I SAM-dependent methyltransferase [Gammaproteobacteria bacterium]